MLVQNGWLNIYKKNQLDSVHILDHKAELFCFFSEVHNQKVEEIIEGDNDFNKFFSVIDYLRFCNCCNYYQRKY